jgi:hypothetical protein
MADAFLILGFLLVVIGVGLLSVPVALIVAGTLLFLAGGQAHGRVE